MGDEAVGVFVVDRADDARLAVVPARGADAGPGAGARPASVGADDKRRRQSPPVGQRQPGGGGAQVHGGDLGGGDDGQVPGRPLRVMERAAQMAVFDHVTEGGIADEAVVVMQKQKRARIGDPDVLDRRGPGAQIIP